MTVIVHKAFLFILCKTSKLIFFKFPRDGRGGFYY